MDDVLVNLGDAFETEARFVRTLKLPEAGKARLLKIYDDQAYAAYSKVVLEHSAAPHVEDARDRIVGMGLPIPTPTPEQAAASAALENSRGQYTSATASSSSSCTRQTRSPPPPSANRRWKTPSPRWRPPSPARPPSTSTPR